jgi:hypothetical protein
LKAIGNDEAEVSRVIKAVGYPKATVKKVLVGLNEKGIVALHRHDWPKSLEREQRKLMVKIGSNYYNAVSVMRRNPKQSKGKTALKKTGRALKGFARGTLQSGAEILGAGAMALNPTRKRKKATKKKRNKTVIKAKRVVVLNPKKKRVKRNASRTVSTAKTAKRRARSSSQNSRKKATPRIRSVAKARKAPVKRASKRTLKKSSGLLKKGRKRNNPSAESIRKEFAGSVNGERDLFFPQGTPSGKLAKLGKLVSITTEEGTIKPVSGSAWLCADTKERLHIGSTSNAPLFSGPAHSFGKVSKVEYESSKPHLGYRGPIIWFHHMGEGGGSRPSLYADGKGGLKFKGGNYRLTKRGIEG